MRSRSKVDPRSGPSNRNARSLSVLSYDDLSRHFPVSLVFALRTPFMLPNPIRQLANSPL